MIPTKPIDAMWTDEQWNAIYDKGHNIIVSAGAGSGKTAVLSERVIENLKSGMSIKEILILTFTKAASEEMKERIRKKIKKEETLSKELELIDEAYITTFDSFALSIVKKYHYILNVSPNISIIEESIIKMKKKEILENIFNEYYKNKDYRFLKLINDFTIKDDKDILGSILNIYSKIEMKTNRIEYLDNYINNYYSDEFINKSILKYEELLKNKIKEIIYLIKDLSYYIDNDYVIKINTSFLNLFGSNTYDEILSNLGVVIPRLPMNSSDEVKEKKERISNTLKELKNLCCYMNKEEIVSSIELTKDYVIVIIDIIKELDKEIMKYKYDNDIYEFTDIANLAIKLVSDNNSVREELKNSFKEIMIDEYQDTNDLQESLMNLIGNNNIYMVGDIKQSIYRFRNANPSIFKNKYDNYSKHNGGEKIDLNKNFRSREEVLNNINLLFNKVMDNDIGGADYITSHQMIFGNKSYIKKGKTNQNYDFELYSYLYDKNNIYSKDEIEAFIVCNDIKNKINNKYQIFDKDTGILRDSTYSDYVILMDRTSTFDLYKKVFLYLGVPLELYKDEIMNNDQDIIVLNNLLKLIIKINNNIYDKELEYLFTSIMRSFLINESDNLIYDYIINKTINKSELYNKCKNIKINNKSSYIILNDIIDKFNFYEKLITIGNVNASSIKLESVLNSAKSMSDIGYDIYEFSNYLDNLIKDNIDIKYTEHNSVSNSVKIMTIHKSKGLEYPICYFTGLYKSFNIMDIKDKFTYSNTYGILTPYFNEGVGETIYKPLLKSEYLKEEISEKIRLFYVALTRAKEKMILVLPYKDIESNIGSGIIDSIIRSKYNSLLDIVNSVIPNLKKYITMIDDYKYVTKDYNLLIKKDYKSSIPLSNIKININELNIDNEEIINEHYSKTINKLINKDTKSYMELGIKFHEALEYFDLKNKNYDLIKDNFIKDKVIKFSNLDIFNNINNSKIYNEYEFIYNIDNKKYHGIIDLMIEYDNYIDIIDYKLKDISDTNYINQLNGYKEYINSISNKKVNLYLYSILDNKLMEIK